MPVNADYSKIENWKDVCYAEFDGEEIVNPELECLIIISALVLNMNSLTEKNVEEWGFRLWMWQKLSGPLMRKRESILDKDGNPILDDDGNEKSEIISYELTTDHIRKFIGLTTNIYEYSNAKFKNDMIRRARRMYDDRKDSYND